MKWEASLSLAICMGLFALTAAGLLTGADHRIVVADALGTAAAGVVVLMARPERKAPAGTLSVLLLAVALSVYLAATAHARPWVLSVTLIATFGLALVFLANSWRRARNKTPTKD
jgi:hypothetical protein